MDSFFKMIIKNYNKLAQSKIRRDALQIINSGLEAIKTEKIIKEKIKLKGGFLYIKNNKNKIKKINLRSYKNIYIIGFGKASCPMAKEIEGILGNRINGGIVISTKPIKFKKIMAIKGTHPMPSAKNINAAKKIVNLIKKLDKNDLVICLVSGGGSALLCYPNVPFNDYMKTINKYFASGIDIKALNKIRTKLSYVKGGKLAKLTKAKIVSLIFSDVVGDGLAAISSGPTAGKGLRNVTNILLLNNEVALGAMKKKALSLGLKPIIYSNKVKGEAKYIGKQLLNIFKNKLADCLLFAGETTVTVKGSGLGGRCQELCLAAIEYISKLGGSCLITLGTDGIDGPTGAAGAIIDTNSLKKAGKLGLNYKKYLKNNDSYHFFKKMDDLVFTGLTGSNAADIGLIIRL